MKIGIFTCVVFAFVATTVTAQPLPSGKIVKVVLGIYAPGVDATNQANGPVQKNTFDLLPGMCGQPKTAMPQGTVYNPTKIKFDDPANGALDCVADQSALLTALPVLAGVQAYTAAVQLIDDRGLISVITQSSVSSPFERRLPPAAATGVSVIP